MADAAARSASNEPVCLFQQCSPRPRLTAFGRDDASIDQGQPTHSSFGMPRGVRYLEPAQTLNPELGQDDAWLPVTHTHTTQAALQVGLWFHYMRGCSDLMWNVGRTLLARNKCHAAGLLEQRAARNLPWREAVRRVAQRLMTGINNSRLLHATRLTSVVSSSEWQAFTVSNVSRALAACAAGRIASEAPLLKATLLSNALDYFMAATMLRSLVGTSGELDSLQFYNRCVPPMSTATSGCDSNVEVWDVRFLQQPETLDSIGSRGPAWRGNATSVFARLGDEPAAALQPCTLSDAWHYCVACAGSKLERACCTVNDAPRRVAAPRELGRESCTPTSTTNPNRAAPRVCNYGPQMEPHLLRRLDFRNPLTLETLWSCGSHWWASL